MQSIQVLFRRYKNTRYDKMIPAEMIGIRIMQESKFNESDCLKETNYDLWTSTEDPEIKHSSTRCTAGL